MARSTKLTDAVVKHARQQAQTAESVETLRRALAVLLPAELGVTQDAAARVLSLGLATLKRYQDMVLREAHGQASRRGPRGGRHNETVTLALETDMLRECSQRAVEGGVIVAKQLREDLQRRAGRRIPMYTVYRMLTRHGWRKVAPDTHHPSRDPQAQEAFKKGGSRRHWLPPGAATADPAGRSGWSSRMRPASGG